MSLSTLAYSDAFSLRPVKAAVVSEISEATASSPVSAEERVNFHIGNPVQDPRLVELYSRIALGLGPGNIVAAGDLAAGLSAELGWDAEQRAKLEFLLDLIRKSAPYLPRGGFLKNKPGELIRLFGEWLTRQPELLAYDFGEKTGRREVILASGGIAESLRVFFHALAGQLQHLPASIFSHGIRIPLHLTQFEALHFHPLPEHETAAAEMLGNSLARNAARPSFILLGKILSEETRRALRLLSRDYPLFILEANDAPNHLSLAREAKMMNRTLRFLTPAIFSPRLEGLSTVFIAGSEEFIRMIETVHFQLKGTPSAAEVELLTFLLKRGLPAPRRLAGCGRNAVPGERSHPAGDTPCGRRGHRQNRNQDCPRRQCAGRTDGRPIGCGGGSLGRPPGQDMGAGSPGFLCERPIRGAGFSGDIG